MRSSDLLEKINDQPFVPFRIHLSDGSRLDVTQPGMIVIGRTRAVLPSVWEKDEEGNRVAKHWRTVSLDHIVQFGDIDEAVEGKRRKRK